MAKDLFTKECVIGYSDLFTPRENKASGKLQYSAMLIFNSMADIKNLVDAANEAIGKKYGVNANGSPKVPFKFAFPWKTDADFNPEKDYFQFVKGKIVVNTNTNHPIAVKDNGQATGQVEVLRNPLEIYPGVHGIVAISPFVYESPDGTNKGVKFYLNGVQKTRDGEKWPSSGGSEPEFQPFVPVETEL